MRTALRCARLVLVLAIVSPFAHASIDSLWSSPATSGSKGALYEPNTSRVAYYYALDSAAGICRIYDADNFTQLYSPSLTAGTYTYLWSQYIPDASGNGHPEILVYDYNAATYRYSMKIVDMSTSAAVKSWSNASYSYFPKFIAVTPGSTTLKLGIEKSGGSLAPYPSLLMVYSLGVAAAVAGQGPGAVRSPGIALEQSFPNPANDQAVIEFSLPRPGRAKVTVYNQLGQEVRTLVDRELPAGRHTAHFDAAGLANGAYFYRLQTQDGQDTKRLILVK